MSWFSRARVTMVESHCALHNQLWRHHALHKPIVTSPPEHKQSTWGTMSMCENRLHSLFDRHLCTFVGSSCCIRNEIIRCRELLFIRSLDGVNFPRYITISGNTPLPSPQWQNNHFVSAKTVHHSTSTVIIYLLYVQTLVQKSSSKRQLVCKFGIVASDFCYFCLYIFS